MKVHRGGVPKLGEMMRKTHASSPAERRALEVELMLKVAQEADFLESELDRAEDETGTFPSFKQTVEADLEVYDTIDRFCILYRAGVDLAWFAKREDNIPASPAEQAMFT